MTLILHAHPLSSYCWKVQIALDEKGADWEPRLVDLGNPEARAAFAALWPTAKIPLLQDGDIVVPETSIMIEHVDRRVSGAAALLPADADRQLQVRLWDRLFDNYVMAPMQRYVAQHIKPDGGPDDAVLGGIRAELDMAYGMIESRRPAGTWAVGGDFTLADCAAAPALFYAAIVHPIAPRHRELIAYFERLMDRPSVRRAIAGAQPFFQYYPVPGGIPARFRAYGDAD